ncbi:hypothetical protein Tco_0505607 [Tanacetum coccineum]
MCFSTETGGEILLFPFGSPSCSLSFCFIFRKQCSTSCDHCSLSSTPSSWPTSHIHPSLSSEVDTKNTGSDVDGKENVCDGDDIENVGEGIGEVIVKFMKVLRHSPKWWDQEVLKFLTNKNDAKRSKKFGSSSFNTKFGDASINLNVSARDDDEDDVHVLPLPIDRDKAKGLKKKVVGSSGSSASMNDEALARLMLSELATQNKTVMAMKKEECATFLEIKRREVECRE